MHPADGAEVETSREDAAGSFTVNNIPAGRELTAPTAPETLVTGVQYLAVDDVVPVDQVSFAEPTAIAVFRTFDGLIITARSVKKDGKDWLNLSCSFEEPPPRAPRRRCDRGPQGSRRPRAQAPRAPKAAPKSPEEVKKEAEELGAKLSKWAFAIPEYKAKNFTATIDSLLKPPAAPAPAPTPTPGG